MSGGFAVSRVAKLTKVVITVNICEEIFWQIIIIARFQGVILCCNVTSQDFYVCIRLESKQTQDKCDEWGHFGSVR